MPSIHVANTVNPDPSPIWVNMVHIHLKIMVNLVLVCTLE